MIRFRLTIALIISLAASLLTSSASAMYDPGLGRFCSRDPIEFLGSEYNLFEYTQSKPMVALDPYGLKCTITVTMGHSGEVDQHLDKKKYDKCDRLAPICCFMDGKIKKCVEKNGDDSVVPGWPENDFLIWCSDIPKIPKDSWKPTADTLQGMCDENGCGCKSATVFYKCSPDMKKCTAKLKAEGKIKNDPCGGSSTFDCETKRFKHDY